MPFALVKPNTENYFKFYGLKETFDLNQEELKKLFLEKSKLYHPDFYSDSPPDQSIALAASAYNNTAYKILSNAIRRAQYLIELHLNSENESQALPQSFLMEMMELNESIDEMDAETKPGLIEHLQALKAETFEEIKKQALAENWSDAQIALLQWKYIERLETRLNTDL